MKYLQRTLILITSCLVISTGTYAQASPPINNSNSIAPMLKTVLPSVVQITAQKKPKDLQPIFNQDPATGLSQMSVSLGTGIVIDAKKGMIVTNAHVINDAQQIIVTLKNGNRYYGNVIAKATDMDIAVLHIDATTLQAMPMANMNNVHTGDLVAAIGSPFGLTQTVTRGSISAINRSQPHIGDLSDFIQTDASINPGNSGGPLVNMQGQMVGMNTALIGPDANIGLGFAIPVNVVQSIAEQLIKYGNVKQGLLGVVVQPMTQDLADTIHSPISQGALVTQIIPSSAAAKAGIQDGDIIDAIDGIHTNSAYALKTLVSLHRPDSTITISYWHHGKLTKTTAKLKSQKATLMSTLVIPFVTGLQLQDLNALSADGDLLQGLLVSDVKDHSTGLLAGIQPTDVIVGINSEPCSNLEELKQILANVPEKQQQVLVKLYRDGKFMYTTLNR